MTGRTVWSQYKPFYENADASSKAYNPVELMIYLDVTKPYYVIRGIGAKVKDNNVSVLALWKAKINKDGTLGEDSGPDYEGGSSLEAQLILPPGMVAVAWGMKVTDSDVSNLVLYGRLWNSETRQLEGEAMPYYYDGDSIEMLTPVPEDEQQMIMGIGAGVDDNNVNRIAAGYVTLAPVPDSSTVPVIWGTVDKDGNAISGKNFQSKRTDKGIYQLSFQNAPDVAPVIGLTAGRGDSEDDGSDCLFSYDNVTKTGCTVYSENVGGTNRAPDDEYFSFVAFFPASEIPGLVYGSVDESGNTISGSEGWSISPSNSNPGQYKLVFDPAMKPLPNLIMTSGVRKGEDEGSDNLISNGLPTPSANRIFSLDVGNGNNHNSDQAFSFFAWNVNVLPTDPVPSNLRVLARHRILEDGQLEVDDVRMTKEDSDPSVFYVVENLGTGHNKIKYNFPIPEVPVIFACAVKSSNEDNGAERIISYQHASTTSYELWGTKVSGKDRKSEDGITEGTVALPDQFPI